MANATTHDLNEIKRRMQGASGVLKAELSGLRTGRASAHLLDPVMVDAYGTQMPLNQVATVSVPEPRLLSVNVWDRSLVHPVEKAIVNSNLGLSPATEGQTIRLRIPELNEERRKELVKLAHKYAETARVAVRHVRREAMDVIKKLEKDHKISKDDHDRFSGEIQKATDAGIAQPIQSATLEAAIPTAYRAADWEWVGLTRRARVVYASKERVKQDNITYEELADPKWRGKICIRSGQHVYNVALIASMIAHHGEDWTEQWLKGVKANLARKPAGDDRLQVKGVYAGECDIAVGNTYYMGAILKNDKEPEQKEWANSVTIIFPNTGDRGTHVNISGAVVAKYAPHKDNAIKLLEFLASDKGQEMYADVNNEYPVKEGIPWSTLVQSWGDFKPDPISLNDIAALRKKASELVDKVGFDDGPSS